MLNILSWFIVFYIFHFIQGNNPMSNNFTSLSHALTSVITTFIFILLELTDYSSTDNMYETIRSITTGYFMYDVSYIITSKKIDVYQLFFIYHHLASVYFLSCNYILYNTIYLLFWAELSNIPMFLVYYHRENNNRKSLMFWEQVYMCVYGLIRVPIIFIIMLKTLTRVDDFSPVYVMLPIYGVGLYWTCILFNKLR